MQAAHRPVLLTEVVAGLEPVGRRIIVDCTVGLGGHSGALLEAAGDQAILIGLDLDESNLRLAKQNLERFGPRVRLFHANFTEVPAVLREAGVEAADAILADLGVASSQLDDPRRGLSFQQEGPLDMRLDASSGRTAADIVNTLPEAELADLIYQLGEERYSRRVARAIVNARNAAKIETTTRLEEIVFAAMPAQVRRQRRGVHPATRTFQALRIAVNDELRSLEVLLESLPAVLAAGGRCGVISFHSLEDRLVKQAFSRWTATGSARLVTRKPLTAGPEEIAENPRSRSAKFRIIEKVKVIS